MFFQYIEEMSTKKYNFLLAQEFDIQLLIYDLKLN